MTNIIIKPCGCARIPIDTPIEKVRKLLKQGTNCKVARKLWHIHKTIDPYDYAAFGATLEAYFQHGKDG